MPIPADLLRCRMLGGGNTVIDRWWCKRESDPFWRIYRNRDPGAAILSDQGRIELEAGAVYLVPAWTMFRGRCPGPIRHDYLHIQVSGLPPAWLRRAACTPRRLEADAWWGPLLDCIGGEEHPARQMRLQAMLHLAVGQAIADTPMPDGSDRAAEVIAPALRQIDAHLAAPPSVASLATACDVSPDHLARCFAAACGTTPARWIQQQRIAAAAERLADGATIEAAALATGFANRAHFSRVFRRVTGTTPGMSRRSLRGTASQPN
jgi:AraC-like DNA-binding protein